MKAFKTIKTRADADEKAAEGLLDQKRQEEFSVMRASKLKQEGSILHNIKMREKKSGKVTYTCPRGSKLLYIWGKIVYCPQVALRDREEKERIQNQFNIASGLFQSHAVFMAPGSGMLIKQSIKASEEEDADANDKESAGLKSQKIMV